MKNTELGRLGETLAKIYLEVIGHTILFTNYRKRFGEIDIISLLGEVVYCIEVKTWQTTSNFHPLLTFNETKKKRMTRVYHYLLKEQPALAHFTVSFSLAHIDEKREVNFYSHLF